jgi:hypothetical protein
MTEEQRQRQYDQSVQADRIYYLSKALFLLAETYRQPNSTLAQKLDAKRVAEQYAKTAFDCEGGG